MYAVRKPYTASSFEGLQQFGISYKVVLVTSQVIGYMLSKFIGIKVISEVQPKHHHQTFNQFFQALPHRVKEMQE